MWFEAVASARSAAVLRFAAGSLAERCVQPALPAQALLARSSSQRALRPVEVPEPQAVRRARALALGLQQALQEPLPRRALAPRARAPALQPRAAEQTLGAEGLAFRGRADRLDRFDQARGRQERRGRFDQLQGLFRGQRLLALSIGVSAKMSPVSRVDISLSGEAVDELPRHDLFDRARRALHFDSVIALEERGHFLAGRVEQLCNSSKSGQWPILLPLVSFSFLARLAAVAARRREGDFLGGLIPDAWNFRQALGRGPLDGVERLRPASTSLRTVFSPTPSSV